MNFEQQNQKKFPEKKNFRQKSYDFVIQKSFLTNFFFNVAEINLTSWVHCILVLFI